MANLVLSLRIFIASPSDAQVERDVAARLVDELDRQHQLSGLSLTSYRWEINGMPGLGITQDSVMPELQAADLALVIFRDTLGSPARPDSSRTGSLEELSYAIDLAGIGAIDDVFVYANTTRTDTQAAEVAREARRLKNFTVWDYVSLEGFETDLRRQLSMWVNRHILPAKIFSHSLLGEDYPLGPHRDDANLDELFTWEPQLKTIGDVMAQHYQATGDLAVASSLPEVSSTLSELNLDLDIHDVESLLSFSIALSLISSIGANNPALTARRPYWHAVHQQLAAIVRHRDLSLSGVLRKWLTSRVAPNACSDVTRNFAAYVLGMIDARDACGDLAEAMKTDKGRDVRLYAAASLGRMRSRKHLQLMSESWLIETDKVRRRYLGQALARLCGVMEYPL